MALSTRPSRTGSPFTQRPKVANHRKRCGDWELDLMTCAKLSSYLITAVDRRSRYTLIRRVRNKQSGRVMEGILKMFEDIDPSIIKTMTFDNGNEFYYHRMLTEQLGVKVYFADPYKSGQRGTNENTNGLIRQFFPKTMTYAMINPQAVRRVQDLLNDRPRKTHGYKPPSAFIG
ncbi:IS30 family transposase [Rubripirellula lacrimiformis]|nr:IS30 family transposase [Rubripirellula lacrimiformis]